MTEPGFKWSTICSCPENWNFDDCCCGALEKNDQAYEDTFQEVDSKTYLYQVVEINSEDLRGYWVEYPPDIHCFEKQRPKHRPPLAKKSVDVKMSTEKNSAKKETTLIVESPPAEHNSEGAGQPACVFTISEKEWKELGQKLGRIEITTVEREFTDGRLRYFVTFDFEKMYKNSRVLETDPPAAVLQFAKKIENDGFIEALREFCKRP